MLSKQSYLFPLILMFVSTSSQGFDLFPVFGRPGQEKTKIQTGYTFEPGIEMSETVVSHPVYQTTTDALSLSFAGQTTQTDPTIPLPTGVSVPEGLYNFQMGITYARHSPDPAQRSRFWAINGTFGSASDKPFAQAANNTVAGSLFYGLPEQSNGRWLLLLNYSNNRTFLNNIPLPGFAYTYSPQPMTRITLGLPFAFVWWKPSREWTYTVFVVAPWFYNLGAEYELNAHLKFFSNLGLFQKPFLRDQRLDREDRLTFVEKKAVLGIKLPFAQVFEAQLSGGYTFGRIWYEAQRYSDRKDNMTSLESGWLGALALSAKF
jgi:hypothetical protein